MEDLGGDVVVETACGTAPEREAAAIWARATAHRDQLPSAAPVEEKLLGIQRALATEGASLHVARRAGRAVGFCLLVPERDVLEVRYLATDPEVWGSGAGRALLAHVEEWSSRAGHPRGELWVLVENARAISVYQRAGWEPTTLVEERGSAGHPERRYVRSFPSTARKADA